MNVLIFYARAYDFTGKDGKHVSGNIVNYLEEMDPLEGPEERGLRPMDCKAEPEALPVILGAKLPALFEVVFGRRPGRDNKAESFIRTAKLVRPVPVEGLVGPSK